MTEGRRYTVDRFTVEGNTVFTDEQFVALFPGQLDHVYDEGRIRKGLQKARDLYGAAGYFEFTGYPDLTRSDDAGAQPPPALAESAGPPTVSVVLRVQEGPKDFVNRLRFEGNTVTHDAVIRRELGLADGSVFSTEALKTGIRRLNQLGYFKPLEDAKNVTVEKVADRPNTVDVTVKVEEQNRNQINFGAGVSQYEGLFGNITFSTSNFLGRGETLSVTAQAGQRANMREVSFTEPYLFNRPISASASVYSRKLDYYTSGTTVGYSEVREGSSWSVGRLFGSFTRAYLNYTYEIVHVSISDDLLSATSAAASSAGTPSFNLFSDSGRHIDSRVTPSLVYNTVDNPIMPHRGVRLTASTQDRGALPQRRLRLRQARGRSGVVDSDDAPHRRRPPGERRLAPHLRIDDVDGAAVLLPLLPRRRSADPRGRHQNGRTDRLEQPRARRQQIRPLQRRGPHRHRRSRAPGAVPRRRPGVRGIRADEPAKPSHVERRGAPLHDARVERAVPSDLGAQRLSRHVPASPLVPLLGGHHLLTRLPDEAASVRSLIRKSPMFVSRSVLALVLGAAATLSSVGCQSPTSASDTVSVDDYVTSVTTPSIATAIDATDGRTYRVVRGNNQPDEILPFTYTTTFAITFTVTSKATDKNVDLTFPVSITSASGKVQQASGGIVTPPTGGEVEHYDSVILSTSNSSVAAVNGNATLTFQVWYTLPSARKEALVTESVSFKDADGKTFTKSVDVVVAP
ncbi:MAG: POTRA domain-containing protein [Vicinamibacterales bacterium]